MHEQEREPDNNAVPLPGKKKVMPPPGPYFVPPLLSNASEDDASCVLRPSSCASCTAPGVTLGRLPSCGFVTERTVGYDGLLVRRSWWRGCVLIQLPPFGRTGLRLCLASGEACRAPHMSNLSVPVHKSVLREAGFSEEYAVLHWIGSLAAPVFGASGDTLQHYASVTYLMPGVSSSVCRRKD